MSSSTCFLYQFLLVYSNVLLLPDFWPFGLWKIDCKFAFNIYIYVDMIYDISGMDGEAIFFTGRGEARQKIYGTGQGGEPPLPHNAGRGGEGVKICGARRGSGGEHTACIS